jgi:hypothetical protein
VRAGLRRAGLDEPNMLARVVAVAGLAGLAVVIWAFLPLVRALVTPIDTAPSAIVASLHPDAANSWTYRRLLELILLGVAAGTLAVARVRRAEPARVSLGALAALVSVAVLIVIFIAAPWRIVYGSTFREVDLAARRCFILGQQGDEVLLHCAGPDVPRNRIVRRDDPRLRPSERTSKLLDAYVQP